MKRAIKESVRLNSSEGCYVAKVYWADGSSRGTGWSRNEALWDARRKIRRMPRFGM